MGTIVEMPINPEMEEALSRMDEQENDRRSNFSMINFLSIKAQTGAEGYHPPIVNQDGVWQGMTWMDMPGQTYEMKKLNFFLFRRGLYSPDGEANKRDMHVNFCRMQAKTTA